MGISYLYLRVLFKGEDARLEQEQFMHLEANVLNMNKRKKQWIIFISVVILLTIIISSLVYLLEKQPKEKINVLEFSEDNGDLNYGKTEVEDGFYDNDEKLLSIGDECNYSPRGFEIQKSRIYESFEDLNGFMTLAYFFKYQGKSSVLNFSYNCQITKGKCKLIIIDPSKEKIISSIDLNGEGNQDVEINKEGNYYVRLVGEDASGDVEVNASGPNIVYNFSVHEAKSGLYDYN